MINIIYRIDIFQNLQFRFKKMTRCQDVLLKAPYTMIISGATGAGKTQFVAKLIEQQASLHVEPFDEIIISYGVFQPVYAKLAQHPNVTIVEGLPDDAYDDLTKDNVETKNKLLILDDQMIELGEDKRLVKLFTVMRHKKNINNIFNPESVL